MRGTLLLFLNYYGTVSILKAVTPAFGRLAAVEARLEGEYRAGMGRVGREAEEVAFYDGGARERDILTDAYMKLIKHVNSIYKVCLNYPFIDFIMYQYVACIRSASRMSGLKTTSSNIYGPLLVMVLSRSPSSIHALSEHSVLTLHPPPNRPEIYRTTSWPGERRVCLSTFFKVIPHADYT